MMGAGSQRLSHVVEQMVFLTQLETGLLNKEKLLDGRAGRDPIVDPDGGDSLTWGGASPCASRMSASISMTATRTCSFGATRPRSSMPWLGSDPQCAQLLAGWQRDDHRPVGGGPLRLAQHPGPGGGHQRGGLGSWPRRASSRWAVKSRSSRAWGWGCPWRVKLPGSIPARSSCARSSGRARRLDQPATDHRPPDFLARKLSLTPNSPRDIQGWGCAACHSAGSGMPEECLDGYDPDRRRRVPAPRGHLRSVALRRVCHPDGP